MLLSNHRPAADGRTIFGPRYRYSPEEQSDLQRSFKKNWDLPPLSLATTPRRDGGLAERAVVLGGSPWHKVGVADTPLPKAEEILQQILDGLQQDDER